MDVNSFVGNLSEELIRKLREFKSELTEVNDKAYILNSLDELEGKSLYHGTICEYEEEFLDKEKINIFHGMNGTKDNGYGFYLTLNFQQAYEQGMRKKVLSDLKNKKENRNINTDIMIVEKQINVKALKEFFSVNAEKEYLLYNTLDIGEEYGKFILNNRLGKDSVELFIGEMHNLDNKYSLVYGGMADGKVGKLIQDYSDQITRYDDDDDSKEAYRIEFLSDFIKEINRPLKSGKGSQLSIHDENLFKKTVDLKDIIKDF